MLVSWLGFCWTCWSLLLKKMLQQTSANNCESRAPMSYSACHTIQDKQIQYCTCHSRSASRKFEAWSLTHGWSKNEHWFGSPASYPKHTESCSCHANGHRYVTKYWTCQKKLCCDVTQFSKTTPCHENLQSKVTKYCTSCPKWHSNITNVFFACLSCSCFCHVFSAFIMFSVRYCLYLLQVFVYLFFSGPFPSKSHIFKKSATWKCCDSTFFDDIAIYWRFKSRPERQPKTSLVLICFDYVSEIATSELAIGSTKVMKLHFSGHQNWDEESRRRIDVGMD